MLDNDKHTRTRTHAGSHTYAAARACTVHVGVAPALCASPSLHGPACWAACVSASVLSAGGSCSRAAFATSSSPVRCKPCKHTRVKRVLCGLALRTGGPAAQASAARRVDAGLCWHRASTRHWRGVLTPACMICTEAVGVRDDCIAF